MTKKRIRLTESDLHRIVKESVKRVLREGKYLPNGYDEEWENNVDNEGPKYYDEEWNNSYERAKNRLGKLNDTDSVAQPLGTIFKIDHTKNYPYGHYDEYGNMVFEPTWGQEYDGVDYSSDDWDYDKEQPKWKTEMETPSMFRNRPTEFAKDERNIGRKTYMSKNGKFDKDLNKNRMKDANNYKRALKAADQRPLHRKGSLNRAFDD